MQSPTAEAVHSTPGLSDESRNSCSAPRRWEQRWRRRSQKPQKKKKNSDGDGPVAVDWSGF